MRFNLLTSSQACDRCRADKAGCSGEQAPCKRCLEKGLPCSYRQVQPARLDWKLDRLEQKLERFEQLEQKLVSFELLERGRGGGGRRGRGRGAGRGRRGAGARSPVA